MLMSLNASTAMLSVLLIFFHISTLAKMLLVSILMPGDSGLNSATGLQEIHLHIRKVNG